MKQAFFNPAHLVKKSDGTFLPRLSNRFTRFGYAAYRSDGGSADDDDDDEEDIPKEQRKLLKTIKGMVTRSLGKTPTKLEFEAITADFKKLPLDALRSLTDEKTGVLAMIAKQGEEITALRTRVSDAGEDLSLRGQIKKWQTDNKTDLDALRSGQKVSVPTMKLNFGGLSFTTRVNSPMTPANTLVGAALPRPQFEPGFTDIPRYAPTLWNLLTKGRTSANPYYWVNKTTPLGAADFIAPGVAKPGVSFKLETESSVPKKVAVSDKVATELLYDVDGMASYIEDELRWQLLDHTNQILFGSAAASATDPAGIKSYASAFTLTTLNTDNPNIMDALRAVVAQLHSGKLKGKVTLFINEIDAANMDMAKATDSGVYLLPPFVTADGSNIKGATIITTGDVSEIPVGSVLGVMLDYYRIKMYQDFFIAWGWEMDDFTKNLITAIAEMRFHQYVKANEALFAVYDTFVNIEAAIDAAA